MASLLLRRVLRLGGSSQLATRRSTLLRAHGPSSIVQSRGFEELCLNTVLPVDGEWTYSEVWFRVALVVNTATKGSQPRHLKQLQALHEKYREQGLVVVAASFKDLAGHEAISSDELMEQSKSFGVTFPIAAETMGTEDMAYPSFDAIANMHRWCLERNMDNVDKFLMVDDGTHHCAFTTQAEPLSKWVILTIETFIMSVAGKEAHGKLEELVDDMREALETGQDALQAREEAMTEASKEMEETVEAIATVEKAIGEMQQAIEAMQEAIADMEEKMPEAEGVIGEMEDAIAAMQEAVETGQEVIAEMEEAIAETEEAIEEIEEALEDLQEAVDDMEDAVETGNEAFVDGEEMLDDLEQLTVPDGEGLVEVPWWPIDGRKRE